jgi:hypothetical protein
VVDSYRYTPRNYNPVKFTKGLKMDVGGEVEHAAEEGSLAPKPTSKALKTAEGALETKVISVLTGQTNPGKKVGSATEPARPASLKQNVLVAEKKVEKAVIPEQDQIVYVSEEVPIEAYEGVPQEGCCGACGCGQCSCNCMIGGPEGVSISR